MTNTELFASTYSEILADLFRTHPAEYGGQDPASAPTIARKMISGLKTGGVHFGEGLARTAKKLGIPKNQKAVREFLLRDTQLTA